MSGAVAHEECIEFEVHVSARRKRVHVVGDPIVLAHRYGKLTGGAV